MCVGQEESAATVPLDRANEQTDEEPGRPAWACWRVAPRVILRLRLGDHCHAEISNDGSRWRLLLEGSDRFVTDNCEEAQELAEERLVAILATALETLKGHPDRREEDAA